jgi:hypothetical protein
MVMGFAGKYGGNGFLLNHMGVINDGYLEIMAVTQRYGFKQLAEMMDKSIKLGGTQGYDPNIVQFRGLTAKIEYKDHSKNNTKQKLLHYYVIDGEDLFYENFVKFEVEKQGLEVIVDFDYLMESQNVFQKVNNEEASK